MSRIVFLALALALAVPAFAAGPVKHVDLDRPGALEALQAENPAHYRRAIEVLRVAETTPCRMQPGAIEARFDPAGYSCAPTLLMTSFPPKRRIAFTLEDTRYLAVVTIVDAGARLMPAN